MGWIAIDRDIQEHWVWNNKPFAYGQAWIDMILLANYRDKTTTYMGEVITCKRGTVNLSITTLAKRWGWTWKRTKTFLRLLEKDGMVTTHVTTNRTTITIENYGFFQDVGRTNDTANDTANDRTSNRANDTASDIQLNKETKKQRNKGRRGEPPDRDDWLRQMYLEALREEAEENAKK